MRRIRDSTSSVAGNPVMEEVGSNRNGTSGTAPSPCLRSLSSAMGYRERQHKIEAQDKERAA